MARDFIAGDLDFVATLVNPASDRIAVRRGNGDATFTTTSTLQVPDGIPGTITSVDLNDDRILDLVMLMQVRVALGMGDGQFDSLPLCG